MKKIIDQIQKKDARINYRGESPSRLDNLTDAVFGIAITLLIFNITNPNSFEALLDFTKTFPAFLISIFFLILVWSEHASFSRIYGLNEFSFKIINVIFIALIIFYVYPLRFLSLVLTKFYFGLDLEVEVELHQMPDLMIYYGFVATALYVTLFFFYVMAIKKQKELGLNDFELLTTKQQKLRIIIMFSIPLLSILVAFTFKFFSITLASIFSGMVYGLYVPAIMTWSKRFKKKKEGFSVGG